MRARVDCSPTTKGYDVSDPSSWLNTYDLTNTSAWDTSMNPKNITKGYRLSNMSLYTTGYRSPFWDKSSHGKSVRKKFPCSNTSNAVHAGAWTDFTGEPFSRFPFMFSEWPVNFTVTYIHGVAQADFMAFLSATGSNPNLDPYGGCTDHFGKAKEPTKLNYSMFTDMPMFQSLTCRPVIESASARVNVDAYGHVGSFSLQSEPKAMGDAWKDVFNVHVHNGSSRFDNISWTIGVDDSNVTSRQVNPPHTPPP